MNSKERTLTAMKHKTPDRIPLDGDFRPDVWIKLEKHFKTQDAEKIREELGLDIRYCTAEPSADFKEEAVPSPWSIMDIGIGRNNLVKLQKNGWAEDEYRICRIPNSTGLYWHYAKHPLAAADLEKIQNYSFPDPEAEERYTDLKSDLSFWRDNYFTMVEMKNIFKLCWELRGFEQFMADIMTEPDLVELLADRALEHLMAQARQLAHCGLDMLMLAGDIATQDSLIISPELWRRYFKPRLKLWLEEIRRDSEILFMFHSDGNLNPVFKDLVEIGFDAVTPVQPECMDVAEISRRWGDKVCLHGTISCQQTLPFGSVADVRAEVEQRIACCGREGGLILAPSNTVQPDVPLENILALYSAGKSR